MPPLVFATYLAPCNRPLYEFVAAACGGVLIDGDDWRELMTGSIDVAFICSPPLIWLGGAVEAIAAPVLSDPRYANRPLYSSEVVVGAGCAHASLADLRGEPLARHFVRHFVPPPDYSPIAGALRRLEAAANCR